MPVHSDPSEIARLIREEEGNVVRETFEGAWDTARDQQIDTVTVAGHAVTAVLRQLDAEMGSEAVRRLVESLGERDEAGAFIADLRLH